MKLYPSISHYLKNDPLDSFDQALEISQRPILAIEKGEFLEEIPNFLIPLTATHYEICFPLIALSDWDTDKSLVTKVCLNLQQDSQTHQKFLTLQGNIFDATQINEEKTHERLQQELGEQYDFLTADAIAIFLGLFYGMLAQRRSQRTFPLLGLLDYLQVLSRDDARLPLVIALDNRYQLRHHLEVITPKLRSQLNRTAEMMPLGRIQEMDAYCLRDYVRRPGRNAAEKAGARQELLGIQRYQNYNTPENKFLKGFCELLHLECQKYSDRPEAKRLQSSINYFFQEPNVQTIQKGLSLLDKPNYVLEQNAIYRSFYQAYLDFVHRRSDKEKLWGVRRKLAGDVIAILVIASLLNLQGSYVESKASLPILDVSQYGCYLENNALPIIECYLQTMVLSFQLKRSTDIKEGDWILEITKHDFNSFNVVVIKLPIWVFWYFPGEEFLKTLSTDSFCCYFYNLPGEDHQASLEKLTRISGKLKLLQILDPLQHSWQSCVNVLSTQIQHYLEASLR